ncbi:TetR/AcrR family transcriptional regulator [Streptomyces odontomachi]|uniref:TetR/AcrR family transcriptional regulator n=1 Tax=Streptomyces odontomachi TaxID=2944940 RepID=UPI00210D954C|nr:TetR/AcrR family transcriptional regulator [Streptomyces sp. ODS25]
MTTGVRRRMAVEERRRQLIGIALELFSSRSPDEVSIDEIASAAGISRPLVYHYFPGKLGLYEAALQRAAEDLAGRFVEPHQGPFGERLLRVMRRFFDFAEEHSRGFVTLLRGDGAAAPAAGAVVDSVRQAAYEQVLAHLGVSEPPARLDLVLRSWITLVESTALIWLEGPGVPATSAGPWGAIPRAEVERQLVHDFGALLAVAAVHDDGLARLVGQLFAEEPPDGVFGELAERLAALAPAPVTS